MINPNKENKMKKEFTLPANNEIEIKECAVKTVFKNVGKTRIKVRKNIFFPRN